MSKSANFFSSLSDVERFAYLQAMGVPEWIPRTSVSKAIPIQQTRPQQTIQSKVKKRQTALNATHYLKLVNWGAEISNARTLLIICRHETDQPAHSFAKLQAPSQFMTDYIRALRSFIETSSSQLRIRLGHLSEAGLGHGCVLLEEVYDEVEPYATLILGDETVKKLLCSEEGVTAHRGRLFELPLCGRCVVSYHPFTLIMNPHLKVRALEDLKFLASILIAD